jgi:4-hydroxybenzoyl-CoA reductase subunit alpha
VENPDPRGPFGAKEVGQGPLLPVMPAVANAVYDAIGVRIDEVPITPEKIVKALQAKAAGREPRYGPTRFPHVPYPEPLDVPTPWQGGDGRSATDPRGAKASAERERGAKASAERGPDASIERMPS